MNPIKILNRSLESEISTEKNTHNYEFNRVIQDYKIQELKQQYQIQASKRMKSINEKYLKTLTRLKEEKEEYIKNEREQELKKLHEKWDEELKKRKENMIINNQKLHNFSEMNLKTKQNFLFQKKKIFENEKKNELDRLKAASRIYYNLNKITHKNREIMENSKHKFENRLNQSLIKFKNQHEFVLNERDNDKKIKIDKQIQKYEDWYINHQLSIKKLKEKKKEDKERKQLRKEEIAEELIAKERKVIEKLDKMDEKKNKVKVQVNQMYHSKSLIELEKYNKLIQNQKVFQKEKEKENFEILERQFQTQYKVKRIEDISNQNKSNLVEKNNVFKHDSVKTIFDFYKELETCKSQSILKKSPDQRMKLYLNIKKKEEQDKKILQGDKNKKSI